MALDAQFPVLGGMVTGAAASRPDTISGLDAEFRGSFQRMLKDAPERVRKELKLTSGFRSPELQAQLWKEALQKYGSPKEARKWVAPPGKSKHNSGHAADLHYASDRTKEWVMNNAGKYGLAFPLKNEPWHMELASARKQAAQQQAPPPDVTGAAGDEAMVGQGESDEPQRAAMFMTPAQMERRAYEAFNAGEMPPDVAESYLADIEAGEVTPPGPLRVPAEAWEAYRAGEMPEEVARSLEADIQSGMWEPPEQGLLSQAADLITGSNRRVASTEALPGIGDMPELNAFDAENWWRSALAAGGSLFAAPDEQAQIIAEQFPGVEVREDAAGNIILKSSIDGQEYAIKPGLRLSDAPRLVGSVAAFTPAGRVGSIAGRVGASAATEAAIQGTQEVTGGEFSPLDVGLAGAGEAAGQLVTGAAKGVARGAREFRRVTDMGERLARGADDAAPDVRGADVGDLARRAARGGRGSRESVALLAREAQPNPQAMQAAKELGIDVPADVVIDDPMVKRGIGITRSVAGSQADVDFKTAVGTAIEQADEAIERFGASMNAGQPNMAGVSEGVRQSLTASEQALKKTAGRLFDQVDEAVDVRARIEAPNLMQFLRGKADDLGGVEFLKPDERRMLKTLEDGPVTYAWLRNERQKAGSVVGGLSSPYNDISGAEAKQLYGVMASDQAAAVQEMAGDEALAAFREANRTTQLYKGLQQRIVNAFGKDLDGSIAQKLRTAMTSASKGDVRALNQVIKAIPPELQREAIATAIADIARSSRSGARGFGFSQFAQFHDALKGNKPVYNMVVSKLGGTDAARFMDNLADLSKRITEARANVIQTGKANQALAQSMLAEGVVQKVLGSSITRRAAEGAGAAGGAMAGGGMGAGVGAVAAGALLGLAEKVTASDAINKAGRMFASEQFKDALEEAISNPRVSDRAIRRLARSSAFRKWAEAIGDPQIIRRPERYIISVLQSARQQATGDEE